MKTLVIGLLLALSLASKAADISATAIATPVINSYESKTSLYTDSIQIHDVTKIRSLLKAMRICDIGAYSYHYRKSNGLSKHMAVFYSRFFWENA